MNISRIKEWKLHSTKADRLLMQDDLDYFLKNEEMDRIDLSTRNCRLSGRVFGKEGFKDGDAIHTSAIKRIDRIKKGDSGSDLLVTTVTGSEYCINLADLRRS